MALDDMPGKSDIASENAPPLHPHTREAYDVYIKTVEEDDGGLVRAAGMFWCILLAFVLGLFLFGLFGYLQAVVFNLPHMFIMFPPNRWHVADLSVYLSGCVLFPFFFWRLRGWRLSLFDSSAKRRRVEERVEVDGGAAGDRNRSAWDFVPGS